MCLCNWKHVYRISQIVSWPFFNHWSLETKKWLLLSVICGAKTQWLIPLNLYCCLKWRKNKPQWEFCTSPVQLAQVPQSVYLFVLKLILNILPFGCWYFQIRVDNISISCDSLVRQSFLYGCSKKIPLTNLITLCLLIYLLFQMRGQWINVYNYFTEKKKKFRHRGNGERMSESLLKGG